MLPTIFSQWLLYTVCFAWRISTKLTYTGAEHIHSIKRPFILASNHRSKSDPFLLSLLPFSVVRRLIPLRFPTTSLYFDKIFYRLFISPMGAYRMQRWSVSLEDYMKDTVGILNSGCAILIFPEGKIIKKGEVSSAKPGLAFLAKTTGAQVIPLRIQEIARGNFFKRSIIKLSFGQSLVLKDKDFSKDKLRQDSQNILNLIYDLS